MFDLFCNFHFFVAAPTSRYFQFYEQWQFVAASLFRCFESSHRRDLRPSTNISYIIITNLTTTTQNIFSDWRQSQSRTLRTPQWWNITLQAHKCFPSFLDLSMRKNIFPCPRKSYLDAAGGCSECSQFRQKVFLSENLCYVHVVVCLRMHLCFNARCICQMCICQMFTFRMLCIGCYVLFIQCTDPWIKMPNADGLELLTRHSECHVMAVVICC